MAKKLLTDAELKPSMRSFQLSIEEIGRICTVYQGMIEENPRLLTYQRSAELGSDWISREKDSEIEAEEFKKSLSQDDFY